MVAHICQHAYIHMYVSMYVCMNINVQLCMHVDERTHMATNVKYL